ncbi:putative Diguanylate cyclase [Pseudodesulfovibrio profundus]|uniref:Putative Diguanylate cyclase n=2 Tax=Pseudodesulfovibrio profundus TaxID=57320 RepID=A0A2C8F806_9BACT|nr:putative Diguanylate cyclase [Pseudodesulfovibrio profundus]
MVKRDNTTVDHFDTIGILYKGSGSEDSVHTYSYAESSNDGSSLSFRSSMCHNGAIHGTVKPKGPMPARFKSLPLHPMPKRRGAGFPDLLSSAREKRTFSVPVPVADGTYRAFNLNTLRSSNGDMDTNIQEHLNNDIIHVQDDDIVENDLMDIVAQNDKVIIVHNADGPIGWTTVHESLLNSTAAPLTRAKDYLIDNRHVVLSLTRSVYGAHKELFSQQRSVVLVIDDQGELLGTITDRDISRLIEKGCDIWNTELANEVKPSHVLTENKPISLNDLDMVASYAERPVPIISSAGSLMGIADIKKMRRYLNSAAEITQENSTEAAPMNPISLSESMILDAVLSDTLRTGIVGTDEFLNIIYFNEAILDFIQKPELLRLGSKIWAVTDSCAISQQSLNAMLDTVKEDGEQIFANWITINEGKRYIQCRLSTVKQRAHTAGFVLSVQDITAQRNAEEAIRKLAYQDRLTQLPNRLLFEERLSLEAKRSERNGSQFAIMMLDLDGFKAVNDDYGHSAGDQLLQIMGERLLNSIRGSDTVARFGGDEFVFILPDVSNPQDVETIAEKIQDIIHKPCEINGTVFHVGASIGYSIYPDDAEDPKALLDLADTRMYKNKRENC